MPAKERVTPSGLPALDPDDDAPELTEEWFQTADMHLGGKLIRRGRPKSDMTKVPVSIRLSPDVLAHFKAGGPGWQTRIDATLSRAIKRRARTKA